VLADCRAEAAARLAAGSTKPRTWIGAAAIVALWLLLAALGIWLTARAFIR
jgi:hypothetical protein